MITVRLKRNEKQEILAFSVSGHADFAPHGEDLVCASVSTVTFGTINALHALVTQEIEVEKGDSGFLSCKLSENCSKKQFEQAQLLFESMVIMLKQIELLYVNQYIEILDEM